MSTSIDTPHSSQLEGERSQGTVVGNPSSKFGTHKDLELVEEQRIAMLENFDMEVEDKIRSMRAQLEADKQELILKAECEIAQLPKHVREMSFGGDIHAALRSALRVDQQGVNGMFDLPEMTRTRARPKA
ncbi:hypothetical protein DL89DRAFT_265913 [Linderina pennispora]|uniref:Borealin N-terminal domain-containing protein n=1 Tax=Linderina pennispora TaxID=61395 RepID=A0A1Y1WG56_9FUNG|nr:uncharacterized protein DL89DRAFT_265913 [Linderina pennispora]ORX72328.1 hypothetical protein DL89DRAFT_265913 [Linderina pennispora]